VNQAITHVGIIANATFVLGLSIGREMNASEFGDAVIDGSGSLHHALTNMKHIVRKAGDTKIKTLRAQLLAQPGVTVIDYTEAASTSDYDEYVRTLENQKSDEIIYRAIHILGPQEIVEPLTKNLSRL